jgi:hypothetical protein
LNIPVTVAGPTSEFSQFALPTPIVLAPGEKRGMYVYGSASSLVYNNSANSSATPITNGDLTLTPGGAAQALFPATLLSPRTPNVIFNYEFLTSGAPIVQTQGFASGEEFPVGTTTNCFSLTDAQGNTSSCCFDVTVNEYPNATTTLACNDNVQISLDEDCVSIIGADQVLEGGPYGCYDTRYQVNILTPTGGMLPAPATVNSSNIGQTLTVKVTDLETGSSCWGTIHVEDKLKPVVDCEDLALPCTAPSTAVGATDTFFSVGTPVTFPAGTQYNTVTIPVSGIPATARILDVNLYMAGTFGADFQDMWIESPSGTQVGIWEFIGGCGGWNVWFDDESAVCDFLCATLNNASGLSEHQMPVCMAAAFGFPDDLPPPYGVLSQFDGELASGDWKLVASNFFGNPMQVTGARLVINWFDGEATYQPDVTENCGSYTLSSVDNVVESGCGGPSRTIYRTWTATDASGNTSAPCTQEITFIRPDLDAVEVPADIKWTCDQYNYDNDITDPTPLHPYITDTDGGTDIIDVNLDENCDDADQSFQDDPTVNSTNTVNGGGGCPGFGLDDADVLNLTGSGVPTVAGLPLADICDIGVEWSDDTIYVCPGTFKILREWKLIDWCANPVDVRVFFQVIKVTDEEPPTLKMVSQDTFHQVFTLGAPGPLVVNGVNTTVNAVTPTTYTIGDTTQLYFTGNTLTAWDVVEDVILLPAQVKLKLRKYTFVTQLTINVYSASVPANGGPHAVCEGNFLIPPATSMGDNCSGVAGYTTELWTVNAQNQPVQQIASQAGNGGTFYGVPLYINGQAAKYLVRYYAVDGCNNQTYIDIIITLRDKVPPVAICDEITEVSITNNGLQTGTSCSTLPAEDLDDGSYDNCTPVYFLIAKMNDLIQPNPSCMNLQGWFYPEEHFCCEDLGDQQVVLMVLDGPPFLYTNFANNRLGVFLSCSPQGYIIQGNANLNFNTCMVTVQVTDKLPPIFTVCPANQRITCDWYADNLEQYFGNETDYTDQQQCDILTSKGFGNVSTFDNCATNLTCTANASIDQCYEGVITRTWVLKDDQGNQASPNCVQRIFVDHVSDFVVEFPVDKTVNCVPGMDPVAEFGLPEIFYETCELIAVSHHDTYFDDVSDACYKIIRQWTVINWCVVGVNVDQEVVESSERDFQLAFPLEPCDFNGDGQCNTQTFRDSWRVSPKSKPGANIAIQSSNPDTDPDSDPWDGYITYEQIIKVIDQVDPVIADCQIADVCVYEGNCLTTVTLTPPDVDDCSQYVLTLTTNLPNAAANNPQANGTYVFTNVPLGTYNVSWKAVDECNNWDVCSTTVDVVDCKKPTPYCKNGLVIELMNTDPAMVQVWASDFDAGSFDNCPGTLKISFSANTSDIGRTYDCDDVGQQPVQMWVTDASGNQDYCETFVIIQANMGQCEDSTILVAGNIATEDNEDVEGVEVSINSPGGFNAGTVTAASGNYNFNVPAGGDYTITPLLDSDPLNGVSTFDLVLISKHILGIQALDSPYKIIAADANKSNTVSTFDLVEIRKLILFINTDFPNNTSWRFVNKDYVFPNPTNPFTAQFPEVQNLNNLTAAELAADFVAIKVGDVNGNAGTSLQGSTEDRNKVGDLVFNTDELNLTAGERYTVEFRATEFNVSGYQFTLHFDTDALSFEGIEPGLAEAGNFGTTLVDKGVLTTSWNSDAAKQLASGEVVFALSFKAKQNGRLSEVLSISDRYTAAEAYNSNNELLNVALSFNNVLAAAGFELYQNTPNPFAQGTTIGFYLPEATSAKLTISDVSGKVIKIIEGEYSKGYNTVSLKRSEMGASGVMYYRLDTNTDSATRKMILVD